MGISEVLIDQPLSFKHAPRQTNTDWAQPVGDNKLDWHCSGQWPVGPASLFNLPLTLPKTCKAQGADLKNAMF